MKGNVLDFKWCVIYTRPKAEKKVAESIANLGIESYVPLHTVVRQWSDRKRKLEVPLFSNYVFVKLILIQKFRILDVPGVVRFLSTAGDVDEIPQKEISLIQNVLELNPRVATDSFTRGTWVNVIKGPFRGMKAVLENLKGHWRLSLMIQCINKIVKVDVSPDCVEKIGQEV